MVTKKYIFETRRTKLKRLLSRLLWVPVGLVGFYLCVAIYLLIFSNKTNEETQNQLYNSPPDLIVVLTGDQGRLKYAFDLLEKYPQSELFITGVYSKNHLSLLLKQLGIQESVDGYLERRAHRIQLEYKAKSTLENAMATKYFLNKQPNSKRVLVISHDYHLKRVSMLFQNFMDREFYFHGIKSDFTSIRKLKILYREVYKTLGTSIFLVFLDH